MSSSHRRLVAAALLLGAPLPALAVDVSPPAILQWFDSTFRTIEDRTPDLFLAGYGFVWVPPPYRADSGSVGYDVYDRFDLGRPGRPTLYGTEEGLRALARMLHRAGLSLHVDYVMNHNGFSNFGTPGFVAAGGYPGMAITLPNDIDGDFHSCLGARCGPSRGWGCSLRF
ncbi:MAG: alpha-amylase family glycosyl hydrolase [Gammaproteobacteria bacterium]